MYVGFPSHVNCQRPTNGFYSAAPSDHFYNLILKNALVVQHFSSSVKGGLKLLKRYQEVMKIDSIKVSVVFLKRQNLNTSLDEIGRRFPILHFSRSFDTF